MNRLLNSVRNKAVDILRISNEIPMVRYQSHSETVTEEVIESILRKKFPSSQTIKVEDVSGGCGAMFNIYIESNDFKGLSIPKQHRTVVDTLKEQIKNIHGLHLETKIPR